MLPGSASIQGPLSIGCPHGGSGRGLKYERALVMACPILLLFAHHCGISAERSATCCFQRGYRSQQEREESPAQARGVFLVITAGTGRRAAERGGAGSAQCGRTVWIAIRIAVVRMQDDWRRGIPIHGMGPGARLMTNRVRKGERAGERERGG